MNVKINIKTVIHTMIYFCNNFLFFLSVVLFPLVSTKFYTTNDRVHFPENFVGSNLFGDGKFVKKCFSMEEVALLSVRKKFEVQFLLVVKHFQVRFYFYLGTYAKFYYIFKSFGE